jgi:hypothetical protein
MKITNLKIRGTTGENKRPVSGSAVFDDGRGYDWLICPDGEVVFFTTRSTHQGAGSSLVSFASPKRAAALRQSL